MGKITGFMEYPRLSETYESPEQRLKHSHEFAPRLSDIEVKQQAARCMDCGIPFCHNACPVNNIIPDWNDLVYHEQWKSALEVLHETNNFPEITGRVCPAPCESGCTLYINDDAVGIKSIERAIADRAWEMGWVTPKPAGQKTNKTVAIVGSGPAGLACAQQLAREGYTVTVYEKNDRIGGLLRYGIPDFKLDKSVIDRRVQQMELEGVCFITKTAVVEQQPSDPQDINYVLAADLMRDFDAVVLAAGAEQARDLPILGRELKGVHFAMEFLPQYNKKIAGDKLNAPINAAGKHVVVIGGGDTGSDCVGTSNRQGAKSVLQLELMPEPPVTENRALTWPNWPYRLRTSSSHDEGCEREFAVLTKAFQGKSGQLKSLLLTKVQTQVDELTGQSKLVEVADSSYEVPADLVFLAMGFVSPVPALLQAFGVQADNRGNVQTLAYQTNHAKLFAAGDVRRGQSLVVWGIKEGRECAAAVAQFLQA